MEENKFLYIYSSEEKIFSGKLEKENKFYKFIWLRKGENNFLRFYKLKN